MTEYAKDEPFWNTRILSRQPMLRLVSSESIYIGTPFSEVDVLRSVAKILMQYGQYPVLGPDWQSRGIWWIPGLSRFRWVKERWGYMHVSNTHHPYRVFCTRLSVLFDAVSGKLVRFRYDDGREARWVWEMHKFGEIEGGLVERPDDCVYRDPSPGEDPVEVFVAGVLRNNARRIAAGL